MHILKIMDLLVIFSPTDLGNHSTWKMPIKKFIKECLLIFKIVGDEIININTSIDNF